MSTEATPLIVVRPRMWVWWTLFLYLPLGLFVPIGFLLAFVEAVSDWRPSPAMIWSAWGCLLVVVMTWCCIYDPELLTWTLTTTDLRRGKKWPKVIFRFDDVESIVIGVPPHMPWFLSWGCIHPAFRRAWALRCLSVFVRLRGGRRIPLNLLSRQFLDGYMLMEQFVRLHATKVVGHDTYTDQELRKMERADLNRVFSVSL